MLSLKYEFTFINSLIAFVCLDIIHFPRNNFLLNLEGISVRLPNAFLFASIFLDKRLKKFVYGMVQLFYGLS